MFRPKFYMSPEKFTQAALGLLGTFSRCERRGPLRERGEMRENRRERRGERRDERGEERRQLDVAPPGVVVPRRRGERIGDRRIRRRRGERRRDCQVARLPESGRDCQVA